MRIVTSSLRILPLSGVEFIQHKFLPDTVSPAQNFFSQASPKYIWFYTDLTLFQSKLVGVMLVCYTRTKRISSSTTIHGCLFGQSSSIQGNNSGPSLQMDMGTSFSRPVRIASSAGLSWFGTIGINEAPTEFEFHQSYDYADIRKTLTKKINDGKTGMWC